MHLSLRGDDSNIMKYVDNSEKSSPEPMSQFQPNLVQSTLGKGNSTLFFLTNEGSFFCQNGDDIFIFFFQWYCHSIACVLLKTLSHESVVGHGPLVPVVLVLVLQSLY